MKANSTQERHRRIFFYRQSRFFALKCLFMHIRAYVLTLLPAIEILARVYRRETIGLNTLSMIAKLYVVTYIPLKSQKSAILSRSLCCEIPGERDQRGNAAQLRTSMARAIRRYQKTQISWRKGGYADAKESPRRRPWYAVAAYSRCGKVPWRRRAGKINRSLV